MAPSGILSIYRWQNVLHMDGYKNILLKNINKQEPKWRALYEKLVNNTWILGITTNKLYIFHY